MELKKITNEFYTLIPFEGNCFGAEVIDFDIDNCKLSKQIIEQLKNDIMDYRLLQFRKTKLTGQRQVDISQELGKVESTFYKHPKSPHPDIFRVSNDENEGCTRVGTTGWHIDGTFMEKPFVYQTMHFPKTIEDGATWFLPLKEVYDMQSDEVKDRFNRLWMCAGRRMAPCHPLVYVHPYRRDTTMCFHCGGSFVTNWLQDNDELPSENRQPMESLTRESVQNEINNLMMSSPLIFKMNWQDGDFAINDNLALGHYACPATQTKNKGLRILHRTTIIGGDETIPTKADGRKSFLVNE